MTTLERYAITIATSADRPKKAHAQSKYLDNHEDACRAVIQSEPHRHESKHVSNGDLRAEQERQRKERAERSKAEAKGGTGEFTLDQLRRQRALLAKVAAKRETTDNIGRKCE